MEELTLEKFEEASEIVKEVTLETKLIYRVTRVTSLWRQRIFFRTDRK